MKKKLSLNLIVLLVLLGAVSFFYFYLKNLKVAENLTSFMPPETVFYVELDLKNEALQKFYETNFRGASRWQGLLKEIGLFDNFSEHLTQEVNSISFLIVDHEGSWHKIWIINSENIHKLQPLLPEEFFVSNLNSKTMALSKNREVLQLIKDTNASLQLTERQQQILAKFSQKYFINAYLSGEYLQSLQDKPEAAYHLILNNLELNLEKAAWFGLKAETEKIDFEFEAELTNKQDSTKFKTNENLLEKIPLENYFLTLATANLKNVWKALSEAMITPEKLKEWELQYEFESKELEKILNNAGALLVRSKSNEKVELINLFNLDNYDYAVIIKNDWDDKELKNNIELIKNLIKNIVAFKYPSEVIKTLPDGSSATEIVANPDKFSFDQEENIEWLELQDFNFVIGNKNNQLVVGNSKKMVSEIMGWERENSLNCELYSDEEVMVLKSNQILKGWLPFIDQTIINWGTKGSKIKLNGCLLW